MPLEDEIHQPSVPLCRSSLECRARIVEAAVEKPRGAQGVMLGAKAAE